MNRQIKFRGKRVDNGEWVFGYLTFFYLNGSEIYTDKARIYDQDNAESHDAWSNTVGQFTGLKDKNGNEIYEGDIIALGSDKEKDKCEVTFRNGQFCIIAPWLVKSRAYAVDPTVELKAYCNRVFNEFVEIIGNIHDNPELLESVRE